MKKRWQKHRPLPARSPGLYLLMWLMLVMSGAGWSQNLVKVEYFFDTDPGYGAGVSMPVTPPVPHLSNFNFNVDITGLGDGFHKLYVRAEDENGVWSLSNSRAFYKNTFTTQLHDLTEVEYFFDTDPGPGNGTNVPFTPGPHITNLQFSIDITGLAPGFHHLYVRAKNQEGIWSLTHRRSFLKEVITMATPLVSMAEYFIDTDPGPGQGTLIPVTPNGSNITLDFNIDLTALPEGFHKLHVRVKDTEGRWSLTSQRSFLKEVITTTNKSITALEYFFDTDPGQGNGQPIPCTPSPSVIVMNHIIDITSLPDGFHDLHIRGMDEAGMWSLTNFRQFYKKDVYLPAPNLTAAEYFFDTDPGFGLGTDIPVPGDTTQGVLSFTADITGLSAGMHKLFVRTMDENGVWGHTNIYMFLKMEAIPGLPSIVYAEYFIDTDPGLGLGTSIPVPNPGPNVDDLVFEVDITGLLMGNHMLFARTLDDAGKWSLTLVYEFCRTPEANFAADDVWFGSPTTFVDLSLFTNPDTQYFWDVDGDGITDYTYNTGFQHTYAAPGSYNARLILVSLEGCSDTVVKTVSVFTCSAPTGLTAINITDVSATLDWTPANIETAWDIEYGLTGFTQGTGTQINNVQPDYYNLGGLASNTTYDFYVRSVCPGSTYSDWAGPATFTTLEGAPCINPTDGGIIAASQAICFGEIPDPFTSVSPATGYTGTLEYKWQLSTDSLVFADIPGTNSETYFHNVALTETTWFRRLARVTCKPDWLGAAESNVVRITVEQRNHYRTKASGDWDNPANWEYFDGTQWVNATNYPSTAFTTCPNPLATVLNGHTVTVTDNVEFGNVIVNTGGTLDIANDVTLDVISGDTLTVFGTLITHQTSVIGGAGHFNLSSDATIHVGSADGIHVVNAVGNIQVTGVRKYASGAHYVYTGTVNQMTGTALTQNTPGNVTINAPGMTVTLSQAIVISGNIHIVQGTLDVNNLDITLGGNWINDGIFIPGTATVQFISNVNVYVSVTNFYHVIFTGSDTITANGSLTVYGNLTINGYFNAGTYTHYVYGNWINNGTFVNGTSTIQFVGTGTISVSVSNFYNVVFACTGTVTAYGSLTIYGNVTINNYFNAGTFTHYVYGNWINSGTFVYGTSTIHFLGTGNITIGVSNFYNVIFGGTGVISATGSLTFYGNVTITNYFAGGTYNHYVYGNWTNTGTFAYGTSTIHFVGAGNISIGAGSFYNIIFSGTGTIIATGSLNILGNVTINTSFNAGSFTHTVAGNWTNNGTFNYGTSTVQFTGTGNVLISVNNFYSVIFAGSGTFTATGSLTFYGNVTINSTFDAGSFVHYVYGNWINNGTFIYGTSTIQFMGSTSITIGVSSFYHIVFAGTGTVTSTGSLTIYGDVTINNHFDAGSFTHYVYGGWFNNGVFVYGTSTITFLGTGNIILGVNSFYSVVFGGTGTYTATGSITFYGNVTINNYFNAGSYVHYVYGNWINNGVFVYGTSTIHFLPTGNITVGVCNFYHIVFAGTGTVNATGSLTIWGNVTIENHFDGATFAHYVYGNWVNIGTFVYGTSTIHFMGTTNITIGVSNFYNIVFGGSGTITATGSLTIYGNVTINTYFNAGSFEHYVHGNWINNGVFVYGTSTIHFVGSGNLSLASDDFYNVVFGGTGTITATGTLTFYGYVTITNHFNAGTFVHYVYGNWINNGTFVHGTSTIHFLGTGNITIGVSNFYHIVFACTGTVAATGSLTIYGDVTISSHFDAASYEHYIYGNWINNGVFVYGTSTIHFVGSGSLSLASDDFYNVVFGGTGTITATGTLTFHGYVSITNHFNAGTFVHYVYGNWTNTGTFVHGTSTIYFVGTGNITIGVSNFYHIVFACTGTVTATGSLTIYGDLTIDHHFDAGSFAHYIYGNWVNNGTFVHGTSTIHFVGSGNIYVGVNNFYNVVFAGSGTVTATGSLTIYGSLTITNYFHAGSFTHYLYGNWIHNGVFVYGTSTIVFCGTAEQTVEGTYEPEFYGFTVNNSLGILQNVHVTVHNMLTLTMGIVTTGVYHFTVLHTGTITGGSATAYINGKLVCGYSTIGSRFFPVGNSIYYAPVTLNYITLTGTSLVKAEFLEGVIPGIIPSFITHVADRYWAISQTGGTVYSYTVTLEVPGFTPAGTVWMLKGDGSTVDAYATTTPNYTNASVFSTMGDITLGDEVCADPYSLTSLDITYTTAELYWEPGYMEQEWNLEYGPAGFSPGTGTLLTNLTSRPVLITGLTPQTYYDFYVQAICSPQLQSNWVGPEPFATFPKHLDIRVLLEGPFEPVTGTMLTTLSNTGYVPLSQPYQGAPWNYSGGEQVTTLPTGAVDWVLVEWRDSPTAGAATSATAIGRKAGFLMFDGSIVDTSGTNLLMIGNPQLSGSLFVVVQHRNHLEVMSSGPLPLAGEIYSWDFTTGSAQAYGGILAHKQLAPGQWGMRSGDADANGEINNIDKNDIWKWQAGSSGYLSGDFSMDGEVNMIDKVDKWSPNTGSSSQVPD